MPTFTVPNSHGAPLLEFNQCHSTDDGKFCATTGAAGSRKGGGPDAHGFSHGKSGSRDIDPRDPASKLTRPVAIRVTNLDEAVALILKGKVVELVDTRAVNTVLTKLAAIATEAERLKEKAPNYDLCNVTVPGTNLFCREKLRTKEHPDGVPRLEMPQFTGTARAGSKADKLPKSEKGNIDGTQAFIRHLTNVGIRTEEGTMPAARLKVSQAQLVGSKVAGMMASKTYDPAKEPIFVSRDGYVIDGHHRWAAVVGRDAGDGRLGNLRMKIVRVDAPIAEILHLANTWARKFGIESKGAA